MPVWLMVALTVLFFYYGFLQPPQTYGPRLKAGFFLMLCLTLFNGYFAWRGTRSVGELSALVDPVPEITEVAYVPTEEELRGIARMTASLPGGSLHGSTQEERQRLAESIDQNSIRYWILKTALPPDEVMTFYRDETHRSGWALESDTPQWLFLGRGEERLSIFVKPQPAGSQILYTYEPKAAPPLDGLPAR